MAFGGFDGALGVGMNIDNDALASPLTFSPSSASSTAGDQSQSRTGGAKGNSGGGRPTLSDAQSVASVDRMNDVESTSGNGGIPFAVDPSLTHPRRVSFPESIDEAEEDGDIPVVAKEEDDDDEELMILNGSGRDTPVPTARSTGAKAGRAVTTSAVAGKSSTSARSESMIPGLSSQGSGSKQSGAVKEGRGQHPHALVDVPDWGDRPSEEEYKKMSSKEKRQLRNKISARNFRHRRKGAPSHLSRVKVLELMPDAHAEHIGTLEQQVAERDQLIDSLRAEIATSRDENKDLRTEVDLLKTKWNDLMKKIEDMSNANPAASTSSAPVAKKAAPAQKSAALPQVNRFKDVGTSRRAFDSTGGMFSNNIGVHTTFVVSWPVSRFPINADNCCLLTADRLIPETPVDPYLSKPAKNMNPALNNLSSTQRSNFSKGLFTAHLRGSLASNPTDDFFSGNPFRLSPEALLEMKRSLYGKQAHNAPAFLAAEQGKQVPEGFKPAFFNDPAKATATKRDLLELAATKKKLQASAASASREPRDVTSAALSAFLESEAAQGRLLGRGNVKKEDQLVSVKQEEVEEPLVPEPKLELSDEDRAKMAFVATLAASFLMQRMSALFIDAFRTSASDVDMVKLQAVLDGQSELKVVDSVPMVRARSESAAGAVSPLASPASTVLSYDSDSTAVDSLGQSFGNLNVVSSSSNRPSSRNGVPDLGGMGIRRCAMNAWAAHHRPGSTETQARPTSPPATTTQ